MSVKNKRQILSDLKKEVNNYDGYSKKLKKTLDIKKQLCYNMQVKICNTEYGGNPNGRSENIYVKNPR